MQGEYIGQGATVCGLVCWQIRSPKVRTFRIFYICAIMQGEYIGQGPAVIALLHTRL